jgi:hypothetical protein
MLEKKMLNLMTVMFLVVALSMLSLYTFEPSLTSMLSLPSQFLFIDGQELKFEQIQCYYCW